MKALLLASVFIISLQVHAFPRYIFRCDLQATYKNSQGIGNTAYENRFENVFTGQHDVLNHWFEFEHEGVAHRIRLHIAYDDFEHAGPSLFGTVFGGPSLITSGSSFGSPEKGHFNFRGPNLSVRCHYFMSEES